MLRTAAKASSRGRLPRTSDGLRLGAAPKGFGAAANVTTLADSEEDRLVAAVREGDNRAFEFVYRRYHARIAAYVCRLVGDHARAEDITQEVFLSALRRMRQTEGRILLKPWLYEIAKNACIDQFRRSQRAEEISFDGDGQLAVPDGARLMAPMPSPDVAVDTKQQLDTLRGAFGSLSEIHHEVLILRELEGRSYREIGERLGLTRPAVESTLFRARRRLSQEFDELASGRSCERVQAAIKLATASTLGSKERRRIAKHLTHCAPCRRQAARLGVDRELFDPGPPSIAHVAAMFPWPAIMLRRLVLVRRSGHMTGVPHSRLAQWTAGFGQAGEGLGVVWAKVVAGAVAVAAVGIGAGADTSAPRHRQLPASAHMTRIGHATVAPIAGSAGSPGRPVGTVRQLRSHAHRAGPAFLVHSPIRHSRRYRPAYLSARPGAPPPTRPGGGHGGGHGVRGQTDPVSPSLPELPAPPTGAPAQPLTDGKVTGAVEGVRKATGAPAPPADVPEAPAIDPGASSPGGARGGPRPPLPG